MFYVDQVYELLSRLTNLLQSVMESSQIATGIVLLFF